MILLVLQKYYIIFIYTNKQRIIWWYAIRHAKQNQVKIYAYLNKVEEKYPNIVSIIIILLMYEIFNCF